MLLAGSGVAQAQAGDKWQQQGMNQLLMGKMAPWRHPLFWGENHYSLSLMQNLVKWQAELPPPFWHMLSPLQMKNKNNVHKAI